MSIQIIGYGFPQMPLRNTSVVSLLRKKNLIIFPAPREESMSQSDFFVCIWNYAWWRFLVSPKLYHLNFLASYILFSCATGMTNLVFTSRFLSYLALLSYHWVMLNCSSLVIICFHEYDNDPLGSLLLFLRSPEVGGSLPFPATPHTSMFPVNGSS